ncbi:hypothetical protein GON26_17935 [Flavobacterium sp. GA093]|uniref:Uncharacterized protein n=1 Tax=Flavobacterium hydrocarbonoxydans TaxID=2683249 RepID=A0A6I4NYY2_9FLAO|nr:hypothetical protein [Flavobacterium hydrocarbonoxydans]MWB96247.1 hypothetical protein [Flavobacterium hydrocarbonoxydans]
MKKYILFLTLVFSSVSFAQTITTKIEDVSISQFELLKKVNEFYPDITLNKQVTNFYADDKIIDSQQEFDLRGTNFSKYRLGIEPDNKKVVFEYTTKDGIVVYGDITYFNGNVLRTTFNKNTNEIEVSLNGKAVYLKKG